MIWKQQENTVGFWANLLGRVVLAIFYLALSSTVSAQTTGNASLSGIVADPTGAVVPGATIRPRRK